MKSEEHVQLADAQALLYQDYAPSIFAYLLRQTGSREDAEDILLEVFLAVLENSRSGRAMRKSNKLGSGGLHAIKPLTITAI